MKYLMTIVMALLATAGFTQETNDIYTKDGDKLCVERFDERGILREEGCFINEKADGKWTQYDIEGNIQMVGYYNQDIKEGKWFAYSTDKKTMYEVVYKDNRVETYNLWKIDKRDLTAGN
jgi:antitoxin component YwqK of YwqJK toxin-antitoxin module